MLYRKKPVVIEAVRWTGLNEVDVYNFLENKNAKTSSEIEDAGKNFYIDFCNGGCQTGNLMIKTLEGEHLASVGDFIIKGIKGEFYPCKSDIFEATYEIVQ